jgi:hypothetical protein
MALATRPKPTVHHKKRRAQHHRHSKHYLKAYWPYLPMLMVVVVGLAINSLWASNTRVLGAYSDFSSQSLLTTTNAARQVEQQPSLVLDNQLTAAAQAKAMDMVSHNYWSHTSPDGQTPWKFIEAAGYSYEQAGENLAYGFNNASTTVTGWMNSPEHRANILNSGYSEVGFGVVSSPNFQNKGPATIVVAMYAKPIAAVSTIRFTVPEPSGTLKGNALGATDQAQPASRLVSRVQILTGGQAPWSMFAVSLLASTALVVFLMHHGLRLRRLIVKGEAYIVHHPVFDLIIIILITAGYVLTRTSGVIR